MTVADDGAALLIVDVQAAFVGPETDATVERIETLLTEWPATPLATTFRNRPDSAFVEVLGYDDAMAEPTLHPPIAEAVPESHRYERSEYGLDGTGVIADIHDAGVERVYLAGLETDACVLACGFDLFDADLRPVLVTDCTGTLGGDTLHDAAVRVAERNFGGTHTAREVTDRHDT